MNQRLLRRASLRFIKREETDQFLEEGDNSPGELLAETMDSRTRSQQQSELLERYAQNIKFFADLYPKAQKMCIEHMLHEFHRTGEVLSTQFVFHQFEEGSRFYVILSGSVAVLKVNRRPDGKPEYSQLAVLTAGSSFGELALISNQPRAASILCREATHLAVLERDEYRRILGRIDNDKLEAKVQLLQKHPAFCTLSKSAIQRISYFFTEKAFKRKQIVFRAGQDANFVYLVKSGDFQLLTEMKFDKTGWKAPGSSGKLRLEREIILISVGEMIGDNEVFNGFPYQLKCMCASATGEVLQISKDDFLKRVANEQSLDYFRSYIAIKENSRNELIGKGSVLRKVYTPAPSPVLPDIYHTEESEKLQNARGQLTKALERRWGLPIRDFPQQTYSSSPLRLPPTPHSHPDTKSPATARASRTWIDLVTLKYFHNPRDSEVFLHLLKEPEQNMSPRWSPSQSRLSRLKLSLRSAM